MQGISWITEELLLASQEWLQYVVSYLVSQWDSQLANYLVTELDNY